MKEQDSTLNDIKMIDDNYYLIINYMRVDEIMRGNTVSPHFFIYKESMNILKI